MRDQLREALFPAGGQGVGGQAAEGFGLREVFADLDGAGVIGGGGDVAGRVGVELAHVEDVPVGVLRSGWALGWPHIRRLQILQRMRDRERLGARASWPGLGAWPRRVSCGARRLPSGRPPEGVGSMMAGWAGPVRRAPMSFRHGCLCGSGRTPGGRCISGWPGWRTGRRGSSRSRGRRPGRWPGRRSAGRGSWARRSFPPRACA